MNQDDAVRATNDDATSCKKSAVDRGYWRDPYIQYFIRSMERKAPEINRGYFARVKGIHTLLKGFIQQCKGACQVVSLGAGFDTTYWNLRDEGLSPTNFIEIDFQGVTAKKCYYIKNRRQFLEKLKAEDGDVEINKYDLHSEKYHIISADLRNLQEVEEKLRGCKLDLTLPTVFFAECVLVYMSGESTTALLQWIARSFTTVFFINYEQVNMGDKFGQVMVENLKTRGCSLPGIEHCLSLHTQKQRFLSTGWSHAEAADMNQVYKALDRTEVHRIEKLEFLDELETLQQLFDHYCINWAYNDPHSMGLHTLTFTPG